MRIPSTGSITQSQHGAANVRLLVAVVIVAVLSAIILPRFVELRAQANEGSTKASMQMVRNAAEEYARQHDGEYAPDATALLLYLPEQHRLANAFTNQLTEPSTGLPALNAPIGSVWYIPARDIHGFVHGYVVRGVSRSGRLALEFSAIH